MSGLDHLWAGWRSAYIDEVSADDRSLRADSAGTLFERILGSDDSDEASYIVHRGELCSTILNAYPYTSGHVLALPNRALVGLDELDDDQAAALWHEVRQAARAVQLAYGCEGMNIGLNLGRAGGAGVPDHLHVHVVPRWSGDTNFMTSTAEARVLPEPLQVSWRKLTEAWPPAG